MILLRFESMLQLHSALYEKCIAADVSTDFDRFSLIFMKCHLIILQNLRKYSRIFQNIPEYSITFDFRVYDRLNLMKIDGNRPKRLVSSHERMQVEPET